MSVQEFRTPVKLKEISDQWWELLFSGPLWRVTLSTLPVTTHLTFREYCLRNAKKRGRRVSIRFRENLKYAYIQGGSATDYMPSVRTSIDTAIDMPPPPAAVKAEKPDLTQKINVTDIIERLLADQTGPPVPAAALVGHPLLGRYVFECTCETENFRTHDPSCPCYTWLPFVELAVVKMSDSPEDWYQRQQGVRLSHPLPAQQRPAPAPTVQPKPFVDPWAPSPVDGGLYTAPPSPGTFTFDAGSVDD